MPSGPEQLRLRLTVMCNAIRMLKLKHTQRHEIKDVGADLFETYKEYLLGGYCYMLRATRSRIRGSHYPSLDLGPQL